jgi:hypothetical protein
VKRSPATTPGAPARALTVLLSFSIANAIHYESGLSFVGLGAPQSNVVDETSIALSISLTDPS